MNSLKTIEVNQGNEYYEAKNGVLYSYGKKQLISYPMGKKDKSYEIDSLTTEIAAYAFFHNDGKVVEKVCSLPEHIVEKHNIQNKKGT